MVWKAKNAQEENEDLAAKKVDQEDYKKESSQVSPDDDEQVDANVKANADAIAEDLLKQPDDDEDDQSAPQDKHIAEK